MNQDVNFGFCVNNSSLMFKAQFPSALLSSANGLKVAVQKGRRFKERLKWKMAQRQTAIQYFSLFDHFTVKYISTNYIFF